jgi:exopolysaccharide biosynthesis polyprenyl glycosylphosphotransferase
MPTKNSQLFGFILVVCDLVVLVAAFTVAYILRVTYDHRPLLNDVYALDYFLTFLAIIPFWIVIFACLSLYSARIYEHRSVAWFRIVLGCFIGILFMIAWEYVSKQPVFPARLVVVYVFIGSSILIIVEREIVRLCQRLLFRNSRGVVRTLIIGSSPVVLDVAKSIADTKKSGYQLVVMAGPEKYLPKNIELKHYDDYQQAIRHLAKHRIGAIIQTNLFEDGTKNQAILSAAQSRHASYSFIPGEPEFYFGKNIVDVFLGYPMISVSQTPLIGWSVIFKRIFDLVAITILLPIWGLVFLLIVLLQKLFNPGPVFFKQRRLGRYKKRFMVYKFRSMKQEYSGKDWQDAIKIFRDMGRNDLAEEYRKTHKVTCDPRISTFGKVLRQTSLDELAQIINVIKGEMSLVGPRPILPDELEFYKNRSPLLLSVKPGLTGLASVSGRSDLSFSDRVSLELIYAKNWTFWLDLKIILKTIKVVLARDGAK